MNVFKCPLCSNSVSERDLLPHPPSDPNASRALAKRYCPKCGTEVRIVSPLRWGHVVAVFGVLVTAVAANHLVLPTSNFAWLARAVFIVAPALVLLIGRSARRLIAVQT